MIKAPSFLFIFFLKLSSGAVFAGGCFWGVEELMHRLMGVEEVITGYTGGKTGSPSYEQVKTGETGHFEAVRIRYNPQEISYEILCKYFLEIHDPTQKEGQGPDHGSQYRSAIFYLNEEQRCTAEKLLNLLRERGLDIQTRLIPFRKFWIAEEYHQGYYRKHNTQPYCHFRVKRF